MEDEDGTEVTIANNKEVKLIGGNVTTINWTDTSTGSDADPYDITFTHDNVTRTNTTTSDSPGYAGSFTAISAVSTSSEGHVTGVTTKTVTLPSAYSLPLASSSTRGGIKTGFSTSGRNYAVLMSGENAYVNVPWVDTNTDTNTTYTAGTGLDLSSGNQFSLESDLRGDVTSIGYNTSAYFYFQQYYARVYFGSLPEFEFQADGDFHADGDVIAFSTTTSSDIKLKDNVEIVGNALNKVCALDGVTFNWKKNGKESAGVIAQNVEEVFPRAVRDVDNLKDDGTHKVVDYNQLSALFIEAIKELKEENAELRAMIEEGKK